MGIINEIFRSYAPEYIHLYGHTMPREHKKIIEAICQCRTETYGSVCYQCEDCGHRHLVPAACGNRHCPGCQHRKSQQWLERQLHRQLPGHHFMLTFTVPEPLRAFLRHHQRIGYGALFEASSEAIKTLAADPKYLDADTPGFFGVLHTWGRQLHYHPHIHYVVPGGALEENRVSFSYKKTGSARLRTLTLDALEFIRRFLQHVLPTGFMKVRYYGCLSPTAKIPLQEIKAKIELANGFTVTVPEVELPPWPQPACQACGGRLRFHSSVRRCRNTPPAPLSARPLSSTAPSAYG